MLYFRCTEKSNYSWIDRHICILYASSDTPAHLEQRQPRTLHPTVYHTQAQAYTQKPDFSPHHFQTTLAKTSAKTLPAPASLSVWKLSLCVLSLCVHNAFLHSLPLCVHCVSVCSLCMNTFFFTICSTQTFCISEYCTLNARALFLSTLLHQVRIAAVYTLSLCAVLLCLHSPSLSVFPLIQPAVPVFTVAESLGLAPACVQMSSISPPLASLSGFVHPLLGSLNNFYSISSFGIHKLWVLTHRNLVHIRNESYQVFQFE